MLTPLIISSFFFSFLYAEITCNYGDTEYDGYCYTFVNQRLLFPDAQAYCAAHGGVLVRTKGESDGRWLTATAATRFHATYGNFWIGLHLEDNKFIWDDGHQVDYLNWAPGYPYSGYDYVGAQLSNTKWSSVTSSSSLPFICYYQKGHHRNQLTTSVPSQNPVGICNGAELLLGHRCYFFNSTLLPYELAKQECENSGKTLAIFDEKSQIQFVTATAISKFSMNYGSFWIGLHKDSTDNQFYWDDGNVDTINNWSPGYPFQHQSVASQQVSNSKWKTSETTSYLSSVCSGYVQ